MGDICAICVNIQNHQSIFLNFRDDPIQNCEARAEKKRSFDEISSSCHHSFSFHNYEFLSLLLFMVIRCLYGAIKEETKHFQFICSVFMCVHVCAHVFAQAKWKFSHLHCALFQLQSPLLLEKHHEVKTSTLHAQC